VVHFVTNLRTVLVAGSGIISKETIPRLHKPFVEFITSERADSQFRIDVHDVDGQIARKCLRLVSKLKNPEQKASLPHGSVQYALHNWTRHLGEGISESGVGAVGRGAERHLSATALRRGLVSMSVTASGDYRTHLYDPKFGLPLPATTLVTPPQYIHLSTIHSQSRVNAIAISPDGMLIASGGYKGVVRIWDSRSHQPIGKAGKHQSYIYSLCFSPDSRWLVSASKDKTIRKWDCGTGQAIGSPLLGHTDDVNSVCTDGQRIISGSVDGTIRIWSCDTHELIGAPIDLGNTVWAVAVSNNGHIAAGVVEVVYIIGIETRQRIALRGHTGNVWTVAISPDGSQVVSGSTDRTIRIWDVQTRRETHKLDGHENSVNYVAFSSDGHWIASGSDDTTVRVWNSQTGQPVGHPLTGHTGFVKGVSFSSDTLRLISGGLDGTIRVWSAVGKWQKPSHQITAIHLSCQPATSVNDRIYLTNRSSVVSPCCSPDGTLYAASTLDGHVSIWNMDRKLLWKTSIFFHPIHLLRFSETQLVLSASDGSTLTWNLLNGIPTNEKAITRRQLDIDQSTSLSNDDMVSWFPFDPDAGLWACVDSCLIRFEGEGTVTIFELP